jgi:hypothetical protein
MTLTGGGGGGAHGRAEERRTGAAKQGQTGTRLDPAGNGWGVRGVEVRRLRKHDGAGIHCLLGLQTEEGGGRRLRHGQGVLVVPVPVRQRRGGASLPELRCRQGSWAGGVGPRLAVLGTRARQPRVMVVVRQVRGGAGIRTLFALYLLCIRTIFVLFCSVFTLYSPCIKATGLHHLHAFEKGQRLWACLTCQHKSPLGQRECFKCSAEGVHSKAVTARSDDARGEKGERGAPVTCPRPSCSHTNPVHRATCAICESALGL